MSCPRCRTNCSTTSVSLSSCDATKKSCSHLSVLSATTATGWNLFANTSAKLAAKSSPQVLELLPQELSFEQVRIINRSMPLRRANEEFDGDHFHLRLQAACGRHDIASQTNAVVGADARVMVADAQPDNAAGEPVGQAVDVDR